ncbi:LexA family protein [Clostridium sp.]
MSEKQKEILEIIKTFIKENGYSQICKLANIKSTASVHGHIKKLNAIALMCTEDKEYILLQENKNKHANESIFELPGGVVKESENVYEYLRHKLKAIGFQLTKIFGENKCNELSYEDQVFTVFKPFCVSQNFNDNNLTISSTILCEVNSANVKNDSNKYDFKWVCTDDLRAMLVEHQENISAHNIAALKLFCNL